MKQMQKAVQRGDNMKGRSRERFVLALDLRKAFLERQKSQELGESKLWHMGSGYGVTRKYLLALAQHD